MLLAFSNAVGQVRTESCTSYVRLKDLRSGPFAFLDTLYDI
jgi:hypothetical protein